jgi:hypothetical protein
MTGLPDLLPVRWTDLFRPTAQGHSTPTAVAPLALSPDRRKCMRQPSPRVWVPTARPSALGYVWGGPYCMEESIDNMSRKMPLALFPKLIRRTFFVLLRPGTEGMSRFKPSSSCRRSHLSGDGTKTRSIGRRNSSLLGLIARDRQSRAFAAESSERLNDSRKLTG